MFSYFSFFVKLADMCEFVRIVDPSPF